MKRAGIHGAGMVSISDMANGAVGGIVAAPWWDPNSEGLCVWSAYQPKGAANFAASLVDLSGLGNNAGDPGGAATPPWDAVNGWKFDGIADYLTTTFVPQNDQTQSALSQFTNYAAGQNRNKLWGMRTGNNRAFASSQRSEINNVVTYANGVAVSVAPWLAAGNLAVAGNRGYRNGVAEGAVIGAWTGSSVNAVYIGARNNAGVVDQFGQHYIQALAIYDCALTAPQVLAIATAMAAL